MESSNRFGGMEPYINYPAEPVRRGSIRYEMQGDDFSRCVRDMLVFFDREDVMEALGYFLDN